MASPFLICVGHRIDHYCDPAGHERCDPSVQEELEPTQEVDRDRFQAALTMLPPVEQLVVRERMAGATEKQIGLRLATSQQAISLRLHRALGRLRFIAEHDLVSLDREDLDLALAGIPELTDMDRRILVSLVETSSYSLTAMRLGLAARASLRRVQRALPFLDATPYGKLFRALTERTNVLREVSPRLRLCSQDTVRCEPSYDGPAELRPLSQGEIEAIRAKVSGGQLPSLVAEEYELDPQYMDFAVFGAWGA